MVANWPQTAARELRLREDDPVGHVTCEFTAPLEIEDETSRRIDHPEVNVLNLGLRGGFGHGVQPLPNVCDLVV